MSTRVKCVIFIVVRRNENVCDIRTFFTEYIWKVDPGNRGRESSSCTILSSRFLDNIRASLVQVQLPREIHMVALLKITRTYTRETCPPTYPKVRLVSGYAERTG